MSQFDTPNLYTHYRSAHFPDLVHVLQYKVTGFLELYGTNSPRIEIIRSCKCFPCL